MKQKHGNMIQNYILTLVSKIVQLQFTFYKTQKK